MNFFKCILAHHQKIDVTTMTLFEYSIRQAADMLQYVLPCVSTTKFHCIPKILGSHENGFLMCQALRNLT